MAIHTNRLAHAYLFWGESGIGKDALAIGFAKTLLCMNNSETACNECSSCKKVDVLQHPNLKLIFPLPGGDGEKSEDEDSLSNDLVEEIKKQVAEKARDPYFHIEIPKAKFIRIKSIREIKKESSLSSAEKGRKIFIIFDVEKMNDAAANSLLKILEEPLEGTHFLLVTSRKDAVKQTIISRCQQVQCSLLSEEEICEALIHRENINEEKSVVTARLANGNYSRALQLINDDLAHYRNDGIKFLRSILGYSSIKLFEEQEGYLSGNKRDDAEQLLQILLVWLRDTIILRENSSSIINHDQQTDLKSFLGKFGQKNLEQCMGVVERSLELLRRNVYLPLVMLSLTVQLRGILNAK
jgi:DNA polymerase III subunit delta'